MRGSSPNTAPPFKKGIESEFPSLEISLVAEKESWRKEINRPIYHIHKWWATRLGSIFRAITLGALSEDSAKIWENFYKDHDFADKVVLDPFMGSGTTLGEALKLGAKAVGCDINPVSSFLVNQAFSDVSEELLLQEFQRLEDKIAPKIRSYYVTKDPVTGINIPVLYYFWVKIVTTPDGEIIPLFSRYVFSQDAYPKKKPKAQIICPSCWTVMEGLYNSETECCPRCNTKFNPQMGPASGQYVTSKKGEKFRIKDLLPKNGEPLAEKMYAIMALKSSGEKIYLSITDFDEKLFAKAKADLTSSEIPLPTMEVRPGHNTNQALGYNYHYWRDFFNARQQLALGTLLQAILEIRDPAVMQQMLCLFSGILEFNNMFCSFKGEGTGAVRHIFSNHILKPERTPLENSVWGTEKSSGTFVSLFQSRLLKAKQYLKKPFEIALNRDLFGNKTEVVKIHSTKPIRAERCEDWNELLSKKHGLLVINGSSAQLPLPSESVDAVITDPPYFDFVHYSELSDFFYAWLILASGKSGIKFPMVNSHHSEEVQDKDPLKFALQLSAVFKESHRVLKSSGLLIFSFHHSKPEGWAAIYEAISLANFQLIAAHPVYAEFRGASPKSISANPISLDAILICKKKQDVDRENSSHNASSETVSSFIRKFNENGFEITQGDKFVIETSLFLVNLGGAVVEYETLCQQIRERFVSPPPSLAVAI